MTSAAATPAVPKVVSNSPLAVNCARPNSDPPPVGTTKPATRNSPFGSSAKANGLNVKLLNAVRVVPLFPNVVSPLPGSVGRLFAQ